MRRVLRQTLIQCVQMPRSTMVTLPLANIAKNLGKPIKPDTEPFTMNLSHMFILAEQGLDASKQGLSASYTRFLFDPNSGKACTVSAIHKSFVACVSPSVVGCLPAMHAMSAMHEMHCLPACDAYNA